MLATTCWIAHAGFDAAWVAVFIVVCQMGPPWLGNLWSQYRVYDDFEALVVSKGLRSERIPLSQIAEVVYEDTEWEQWVHLRLGQPCGFGWEIRFRVSCQLNADVSNKIVDDLRCRSRRFNGGAETSKMQTEGADRNG